MFYGNLQDFRLWEAFLVTLSSQYSVFEKFIQICFYRVSLWHGLAFPLVFIILAQIGSTDIVVFQELISFA
jgi:hypothetical protein